MGIVCWLLLPNCSNLSHSNKINSEINYSQQQALATPTLLLASHITSLIFLHDVISFALRPSLCVSAPCPRANIDWFKQQQYVNQFILMRCISAPAASETDAERCTFYDLQNFTKQIVMLQQLNAVAQWNPAVVQWRPYSPETNANSTTLASFFLVK